MWPVWESLDQRSLSNGFGAASIVFWLFAQLPQLFENYKSGSVEGLALPFLASWLAGDVTNLVGALLTDQLEFQKLLAGYFTFIDVALVAQYVYYNARAEHVPISATSSRHTQRRHRYPTSDGQHAYRHLADSSLPATMTASFLTERSASPGTLKRMSLSRNGSGSSYHAQQSKRRRKDLHANSGRVDTLQASIQTLDEEGDVPQDMLESFQSEASQQSTSSNRTIDALNRGRRISRLARSAPLPPLTASGDLTNPPMRQTSCSRERAVSAMRGHSHSKTRSVVFLSIWAFIGFTRLAGVTAPGLMPVYDSREGPAAQAWKAAPRQNLLSTMSTRSPPVDVAFQVKRDGMPLPPDLPPGDLDVKRLVGRLSAWIAVVFYLTSRMPQIWKNFQRRSVEGLSILLFIAAFHGNLFYVLSILTSPLVQEEEGYLFESVPFLLGSGGTLVFDMIIVFQACIYRKRTHRAVVVSSHILDPEEAAGLLDDDEAGSTARSRSVSASRSRTRLPRTGANQAWPTDRQMSNSTALSRSHSRKRSHVEEPEITVVRSDSGDTSLQ